MNSSFFIVQPLVGVFTDDLAGLFKKLCICMIQVDQIYIPHIQVAQHNILYIQVAQINILYIRVTQLNIPKLR